MTIAEYAHIRVNIMSGFLSTMLISDAIAITITVALLDGNYQEVKMAATTLLVFAAATGVALCFLAKRYLESVNYRFTAIEDAQLEAIARVAKRFFFPFVICFAANIILSTLGSILLLVFSIGS